MKDLLRNGYKAMKRPSGHDISEKFSRDNGAAIPPNLIAVPNTESNGRYLRYCKEQGLKPHPAGFPADVPEFFIRMLTDPEELVVDPFAGSCVTGDVCERTERKWLCIELAEDYLKGAVGRFADQSPAEHRDEPRSYKMYQPGHMWNGTSEPPLRRTEVRNERSVDLTRLVCR